MFANLYKLIPVFVGAVLAYFEPIIGIIYIFVLAFLLDFVTGLAVSFKKGERFKSSKARWSFAKLMVYVGTFAIILFVSNQMHTLQVSDGINEVEAISLMTFLKVCVYGGIWIESKSIIENLSLLYPQNRFLAFMDFMLGLEFAKKIPMLSDFLKEEKEKKNIRDNNDASE